MSTDTVLNSNTTLEKYKANKVYNQDNYNELLSKYTEALKRIELLEGTIAELQKKTIPTVEEIESMRATLGLLGIDKLDVDGIQKFTQIKSMIEGIK